MSKTGIIFNIQRFSIHDGPGIRTTVFLKGCSLRCFWCHNPEGMRRQSEIQFFPEKCMGCNECSLICVENAHVMLHGAHIFQRELCKSCGACAETCYTRSLEFIGDIMTVQDVMKEAMQDITFYETSGGGVTLSGGEPVLQKEFSKSLLHACKAEEIHTAIETCADYRWEKLEELLPFADLIMMDIKHVDPVKHKLATGKSNEKILSNAKRLVHTDKSIIFRIPVIPGFNDSVEEISAIVKFIRSLIDLRMNNGFKGSGFTGIRVELLPFHRLASDKYRSLGLEYKAKNIVPPSKEKMEELFEVMKSYDINF